LWDDPDFPCPCDQIFTLEFHDQSVGRGMFEQSENVSRLHGEKIPDLLCYRETVLRIYRDSIQDVQRITGIVVIGILQQRIIRRIR